MRTKNFILIITLALIACFILSGNVEAQTRHKLVKEGNEKFRDKEYDEAIARYHMAEDKGESGIIDFNLGNSFYKSGNIGRASEVYMKALNDTNSTVRAQAFYNLGNALLDSGLTDMAVKSYINSLRLNPKDMEAKQNLEYALRQLQQQKQQQQNDDKSDQKKQDQQQQQQDQQQNQDKQKQDEQQQQQQQDRQKQEEQQQQQQQAQEQEVQMSKEDAMKLLQALENDEKEVQKKVVQKQMEGRKSKGKNW